MKHEYEGPATKEAIAKCWCGKTKKKYGIVVTSETGERWTVQHSFLCSDHYVDKTAEAKGEIGQVAISDHYNGCKHCGNNDLVQCGDCKQYSCYRAGGISPIKTVRCGNCGMKGIISGHAESMHISKD